MFDVFEGKTLSVFDEDSVTLDSTDVSEIVESVFNIDVNPDTVLCCRGDENIRA